MNDIQRVFNEQLTPEQRDAAIDDAAEILTLACAGSGKSRTLGYRITWLLANGVQASEIVAFTFTDKAAESIKLQVKRALEAVGIDPIVIGRMYIGTIHSYCYDLLSRMDAQYGQYDVLDDNRLVLYLTSRYPQLGLGALRRFHNAGFFQTTKEVSNAWKTANDELLNLDDIETEEPNIGGVLKALEQLLRRDQFIDFSLMIRLAVEAIERGDPDALRATQDLRHLLVDEYQDVNRAQERLIQLLHEGSESLFAVGDDDQAIYAWRGADVSNILTFHERYPGASRHTLPENFRSSPAIVHSSEQLAADVLGARRIEKNARAEEPPGSRDYRVLLFDDRPHESEWVVGRVRLLLETAYLEDWRAGDPQTRGLTPADFAILMRSTRGLEQSGEPHHAAFTQLLDALDIPYTLEAGGGVFSRLQTAVLRQTFELLRDGNPSREVVTLHHNDHVLPVFPNADFDRLSAVLADWGRRIHAPQGGVRQRLYPQMLVHALLDAFRVADSDFHETEWQDMGVFSRIMQDVEAVYLSIDSAERFAGILNFLGNVADSGYDASVVDVLQRPDAVTVSTVHKMKGLEFPVVFLVDAEQGRFPLRRRKYNGWLPDTLLEDAIGRGRYQSTAEEEVRLFYTAVTRAERYLYVTGSRNLPDGRSVRRLSDFALRLQDGEISDDPEGLPENLQQQQGKRRVQEEDIVPTSYSDVRYYLRCPQDYRLRKLFGFSPPITEMFGFGQTVHATLGRLHALYPGSAPSLEEAQGVADDTFHMKHVAPSTDPEERPGPYEQAKNRAREIVAEYAASYANDFMHQRVVEQAFEIPVEHAVISGTIDLLLREDTDGNILEATVIDFKTMEGGPEPEENERLQWTDLALQVQLYAKAANEVLGENARTGAVHLLRDNQRVEVPVDDDAVSAAVQNVEWAVDRIIDHDFPMRPHPNKCGECDFRALCPKVPEEFDGGIEPPPLHLFTDGREQMALAFSEFQTENNG